VKPLNVAEVIAAIGEVVFTALSIEMPFVAPIMIKKTGAASVSMEIGIE